MKLFSKISELLGSLFRIGMGGVHNDPPREPIELSAEGLMSVADKFDDEADAESQPLMALLGPSGSNHISKNFRWKEVRCKDGTYPPKEFLANCINAAFMLERIRTFFGGRKIKVMSWYRSPSHNTKVGGEKNSLHMRGMAVDFVVVGMDPVDVANKLRAAAKELDIGGIGKYKTFTHVDIGRRRNWDGKKKKSGK